MPRFKDTYFLCRLALVPCIAKIGSFYSFNMFPAAPEVYTVIPLQPLEKKPGQLEQWQLEQYFDKGFVQVNDFFTKQELQPILEVRTIGKFVGGAHPLIQLG